MADINQSGTVTEQTPQPTQPATVGAEHAEPTGTKPLSAREEIYNKYYKETGQIKTENTNNNNEQNKSTASQPQDPPADPTPTPTEVAPQPLAESVEETEVENEAVTFLRGMYETNQKLQQKLDALEARLNTPPPTTQTPQTPPVNSVVVTAENDWIEALKTGDFDKARQLVREDAIKAIKSELKISSGEELISNTVAQANTLQRVEQDVMQFSNDIRAKNPDLAPFEPYISSVVKTRVDSEIAAKNISDPVLYGEVFKRVLNEEVNKARQITSQLRAAGKTEAATVQKEILSSTTVAPNAQDQLRGSLSKPEEPKFDTIEDYIKKRQSRNFASRNI